MIFDRHLRRGMNARTVHRFLAKVDRGPPGIADVCWEWTGAKDSHGYGVFRVGSQLIGAHRIAFALAFDRPGKLCVLHACDNRACVNPLHLWLGTHGDNLRDCYAKGRR